MADSRLTYLACDQDYIVRVISDQPFRSEENTVLTLAKHIPKEQWDFLIGKKLPGQHKPKPFSELRVAMVCNWKDQCGIATYSNYLADALRPLVRELRVFAETKDVPAEDGVDRCWRRGENLLNLAKHLLHWEPDFVIIQHEFGIFPNAFYYLQLLQALENIPYAVTMHSIYEHLDKAICSGSTKHIIVHSQQAKEVLRTIGHNNHITVIPHGCVKQNNVQELWNIFRNPYTIVQFGFGFPYKGIDRAIQALHLLKTTDSKFEDIFYTVLISTNDHNMLINNEYYNRLNREVKELGLERNIVIQRGFLSSQILNCFLRTAKIAIFPYRSEPENTVFGASGAIRVAMSNGIPVIASESHLFDDLQDIVPRPNSSHELAQELDHVFSDEQYRKDLLARTGKYMEENTWEQSAKLYLEVYLESFNNSR